jgi:hypothetical protein
MKLIQYDTQSLPLERGAHHLAIFQLHHMTFQSHHSYAKVPAAPDLVHRFLLVQNTVAAQINKNYIGNGNFQFNCHRTSFEPNSWCLKISGLRSGNANIC